MSRPHAAPDQSLVVGLVDAGRSEAITSRAGSTVIGPYASVGLLLAARQAFDVCLLVTGFVTTDIVGRSVAALDGVPLVVICDTRGPGDLRDALAAGARGVIDRHEVGDPMAAVLAVHGGHVVASPTLLKALSRPAFSQREKQVLGLVVLGLSNREIADRLHVVESTVKSHLTSSFAKLGVRTRAQAVNRILDPSGGLGPGILRITPDGS